MDQHNVQDRIQRAKDQLQAMIDLNPDCIMMLARDCYVVRANRSLVELVGKESFDDVLNRPVHEIFNLDGPEALADVLGGEDGYGFCRVDVIFKGNPRTLEFSRVGGEADNSSVFVVVEDITNKLLDDLATEKEHKLTAVKQMLGAMMHHLNQPLTVIMIRANLLTSAVSKGTCSDDQVLDALQEISEMSMKLARLLSEIESRDSFEVQNYTEGIDIMKIDDE